MRLKRLFLALTFLLSPLFTGFAQEPTLLDHGGGVRTVEFSPVDASLLASAGESHLIKLWDLKNDTVRTLSGHTDSVEAVAFSPNGELLASVSDDRTLKLWNVRSQQNIATLREGTQFVSIAFSPDGELLATGGWMHVKLWDVRRHEVIATLEHDKFVRTVAFSHDGQFLAVGDAKERSGSVNVWDVKSREVIATLEEDMVVVRSVTFSSDDRYFASSHYNGEVKVWNVSDWQRLHTIPQAGDYDIAFSPDGKMIAGTGNGYVSLLWTEEGTRAARLSGPTGWMHPVDFSHDGTFLTVGAEDGIVRFWRIDTAPVGEHEEDAVQILHIDTYFQQLPQANSANGDNIPEPVPPPAVVRDFFELDPFYEQWINVGGLPVIASAKVNPYALKEAAWLIEKMIGHRPDVLRAMVRNKARFSVIAHTEIITEIPEYHSDPRPDFLVFRQRGWGGSEAATTSTSEENILNYPGPFSSRYKVLIHELAHGIHKLGLNAFDPTFDKRLQSTYEAAMQKGLWQGTYASSDRKEYWAEGAHAWFHPNGGGSFARFDGDTRQALKQYDPRLATLLAEIYGNREWRYTPVERRTHQSHLRGFNPQDSPTFQGWPELEAIYQQLRNPNSDGGGAWVNLKQYRPNQLQRLTESERPGYTTTVVFVNFTRADVLLYGIHSNGTEGYWTRVPPRGIRETPSKINQIWLIKNANGRNIAVFQAEEKTGRAAIGIAQEDVESVDSAPQALIPQFQRPPMYWIDASTRTLHRLVDAKVELIVPSVENATSLVVDSEGGKLYWTEKTSNKTGRIRRATLDGRNVRLVKDLTSVPRSIAIDSANGKLYLTNSWGKVQRLNFDGSNFQPNLITGLKAPDHITLDVARDKIYWTEKKNRIRRANLDGSNIQTSATDLGTLGGIAVADGKLYWTEQSDESAGRVQRANLDGTNVQTLTSLRSIPLGITLDSAGRTLYWTSSRGTIQRANLTGSKTEVLVVGLDAPAGIALGTRKDVVGPEAPLDKITGPWLWMIAPTQTGQGGANSTNVDSLAAASGGNVTEADVAANGAKEGDTVGDYAWTLSELAAHGSDNVNDVINNIAMAQGDIDDHSAYALITLESIKVESGVTMRVGSDDSIKVWLNGKVVHNNPTNRGAQDFQDTFKVDLNKGDNLLLVKVSDRSEHWTLFVGIGADVKTKTAPAAPLLNATQRRLPTETVLLPNYPNPFNPETWIPYQLSAPAAVTVRLYDMKGVLIRRLTIGHQPAGSYTDRNRAAYWDGRNELGERVASGVYFYTLEAGDFTATRKLLIRK